MQYICQVPTQAFLPSKSQEVVFSQPLGASQKVTPSFFFLVGLVDFFYCSQRKTRGYGNKIEIQERQHPPFKNSAFTVIT